MTETKDLWALWLHHLGIATAYRLEAQTAVRNGEHQAARLLTWEANRHSELAETYRQRLNQKGSAA